MSGIGSSFGLGNVVQATTKMVRGAIKNSEATDKIASGIKQAIVETGQNVLKPQEMMRRKLQGDYGSILGMQLNRELFAKSNILKEDILAVNCSVLQDAQLADDITDYRQGLIDNCKYLQGLKGANYTDEQQKLTEYIVELINSVIKNIQEEEIVHVGADAGGGEIVSQLNHLFVNKYIYKEEIKRTQEDKRLQALKQRLYFMRKLQPSKYISIDLQKENIGVNQSNNMVNGASSALVVASNQLFSAAISDMCASTKGCYLGDNFRYESLLLTVPQMFLPFLLRLRYRRYPYIKLDDDMPIDIKKLGFIVGRDLNLPIKYLSHVFQHVGFRVPSKDGTSPGDIFSFSVDSGVGFSYKGSAEF